MNKVTMTGSFRGRANDWGVSVTSDKGCPQFTMDVVLDEIWNEDDQVWQDYSEQEEYIPAYMVMVSGAGKVLKNMEQIQKVFAWDGLSFTDLATGDYSDVKFQIRIGDNDPEFADKNPFTVEWLDEYDATPGRGIKKLDATELGALDKKFAAILKKKAGPAAAKSAPPKNPKGKAKPEEEAAPASNRQLSAKEKMERNQKQKEIDDKKRDDKVSTAAKLKAEKAELAAKKKAEKVDKSKRGMPKFDKPAPPEDSQEGDLVEQEDEDVVLELTQDEAWERIEAAQEQMGDGCTDDDVNNALMAAIKEVGGSDAPDADAFTKEQWGAVSQATIMALVGV